MNNLEDYDIIGFSANTFNWGITKFAINYIKNKYNRLKIILGGLHSSYFYDHILKTTYCDYIIKGEGEKALPKLVGSIERGEDISSIPNVVYKKDGNIIENEDAKPLSLEYLENTPLPDYEELVKRSHYTNFPVETSRGCPFSCAFCSIFNRHNWRGYNVQTVINRVDYLIETFESQKKEIKNIFLLMIVLLLTILEHRKY